MCSKVHQRLYFLRRLRAFVVNEKILVLFYRSIIESILRYGITVWFGNLSVQSKSQRSHLMRTVMKITGSTSPMISLQESFEHTLRRQSRLFVIPNMFHTMNFSSCHLADAIELLRAGLTYTNTHLCHCPLNNSTHDACFNSVTCRSYHN